MAPTYMAPVIFCLALAMCVSNCLATWIPVSWKETMNINNPLCRIQECCFHPNSFRQNTDNLSIAFENSLFGQHIAKSTVLGAIHGHINDPNPEKALVLSLHGPPGTGKNHISNLIVKSLFHYGMESSFVTLKMSTKDYPHEEQVEQYKEELKSLITEKVSSCPHHLFIFDEIENMPVGLLDFIKVYIDYDAVFNGVDYRRAIFIFRSNLAGADINRYVWNAYEEGRRREDIGLAEMEKLISQSVFEVKGGLYKAKLIDSHLVSHFIPFLPLEISHVRQCIRVEFRRQGYKLKPHWENQVIEKLQFDGSNGRKTFATKGCKNIVEKVNVILFQHGKVKDGQQQPNGQPKHGKEDL